MDWRLGKDSRLFHHRKMDYGAKMGLESVIDRQKRKEEDREIRHAEMAHPYRDLPVESKTVPREGTSAYGGYYKYPLGYRPVVYFGASYGLAEAFDSPGMNGSLYSKAFQMKTKPGTQGTWRRSYVQY